MDFLNNMVSSIIKFPDTLEEKTKVSEQFENVREKLSCKYVSSISLCQILSSNFTLIFF